MTTTNTECRNLTESEAATLADYIRWMGGRHSRCASQSLLVAIAGSDGFAQVAIRPAIDAALAAAPQTETATTSETIRALARNMLFDAARVAERGGSMDEIRAAIPSRVLKMMPGLNAQLR